MQTARFETVQWGCCESAVCLSLLELLSDKLFGHESRMTFLSFTVLLASGVPHSTICFPPSRNSELIPDEL